MDPELGDNRTLDLQRELQKRFDSSRDFRSLRRGISDLGWVCRNVRRDLTQTSHKRNVLVTVSA